MSYLRNNQAAFRLCFDFIPGVALAPDERMVELRSLDTGGEWVSIGREVGRSLRKMLST